MTEAEKAERLFNKLASYGYPVCQFADELYEIYMQTNEKYEILLEKYNKLIEDEK